MDILVLRRKFQVKILGWRDVTHGIREKGPALKLFPTRTEKSKQCMTFLHCGQRLHMLCSACNSLLIQQ